MTISDDLLDRVSASALDSILGHIQSQGATLIRVPTLGTITGACENVDMSFRVDDGRFLIQTGQLFLEAALRQHAHVYCEVWSSRREIVDSRHLDQFTLVEEEFRWTHGPGQPTPEGALQSVIERASAAIKAGIARLLDEFSAELTTLGRVDDLKRTIDAAWPIITHDEAYAIAGRSGRETSDRIDFTAEDEQAIVAQVATDVHALPVFVTRYPEQIKFFNMRVARPDPTRVLSVDLLLPYSGEALGGAVREDEPAALEARLQDSSMLKMHVRNGGSIADFSPYLELVRNGVPAHAGYGLGYERLLQFVLARQDIREASSAFRRSGVLRWGPQC